MNRIIRIIKKTFWWEGAIFGLIFAILFTAGCGSSEMKLAEGEVVTLRSQYEALEEADVKAVLKARGFYDQRWNRTGGFPNRYKPRTVSNEKVVMDLAANLTWHQSGSELPLAFEEAKEWVKELNRKGYAGYTNWRLPTLEEALTLVERKPVDRYHIDPVFAVEQYSMWTGDYYSEVRVWAVSFNLGRVFKNRFSETDYVRPVHTGTAE